MPSIANLEQFKHDIQALANEPQVRSELGEPFDDIPLPEETGAVESAQPIDNDLAALLGISPGSTETPPAAESADALFDSLLPDTDNTAAGDFDIDTFQDLLSNLPLEDTAPQPDIPAARAETGNNISDVSMENEAAADDFGIPGGLLDGLADSLDEANAAAPDYVPPAGGDDGGTADFAPDSDTQTSAANNISDFSDFSLDDLPAFDAAGTDDGVAGSPEAVTNGIPSSFKDGDSGLSAAVDMTPDIETSAPMEDVDETASGLAGLDFPDDGNTEHDNSLESIEPAENPDSVTADFSLPDFASAESASASDFDPADIADFAPDAGTTGVNMDDFPLPNFADADIAASGDSGASANSASANSASANSASANSTSDLDPGDIAGFAPDAGTTDVNMDDFPLPDFADADIAASGDSDSGASANSTSAESASDFDPGDIADFAPDAGTTDVNMDDFSLPDFADASADSGASANSTSANSASDLDPGDIADFAPDAGTTDVNMDDFSLPDFADADIAASGDSADFASADSASANSTSAESARDLDPGDIAGFAPDAGTTDVNMDDFSSPDFAASGDSGGAADTGMDDFSFDMAPTGADGASPANNAAGTIPGFDDDNLDPPTAEEEAAFMANTKTPSDINDIAAGFNSDDDTFSQFSLDKDFVNESFNFTENKLTDIGTEDFSFDGIPGLDGDAFAAKPGAAAKPSGPVTFSINENDFDTFMNALALYPLNLRIEIEDLIVNTQLPDSTIQDIVDKIVKSAPPKNIAAIVSDITGKTIEIPKDFEKKSAESREQEVNSFGYIFRYKILPAAAVGTLGLILLGCLSFLSYEFIYRPIRAGSFYKEGYACIGEKRYAESVSLFNKAVSYNEKKEWYYTYARAYTENKQYQLAENMYDRMLFRYPKDKRPALEYARMECDELHNFPKAENIVRRSVLDNFVNDKDGLLLLGDIFMEWGKTDYTKYSQAGETYDTLIELYGTNDTYLSRKLLYNIRTDDLAEVLPLKDHFMQKNHQLEPPIQIELGGYLLEKRYQPLGSDDEYLRILIEDVRTCLQKGIDAGPEIPEAYYNMGKYFLYTGNSGAKNMLLRSVDLFETVDHMDPARIMRNIDACRLLGETYVRENESLAAAEIYNRGREKYETAITARTIAKDARAGELYADIADIDYFLTGDLGSAERYYQEAIKNLYDTPQVRYKLGFINYSSGRYEQALDSLIRASAAMPEDENTMFAMGNTLFRRKDYAAAQGYYTRLLHRLETRKTRLGILLPQIQPDHGNFVQTYMETANNLAVTLFKLGERTGDIYKQSESGVLLTEALRAYDALTRNPETLVRLSGGNLPELNIKYSRYPEKTYEPSIYANIKPLPDHQHPFIKE